MSQQPPSSRVAHSASDLSAPDLNEDFQYRAGVLHCEGVPLTELAAAVGTPAYLYSRAGLTRQYQAFASGLAALSHQICFAVKANSNLAVLNLLARLGSGFDIVSGGELERVLRAGGSPAKVVFSGVGKSPAEIQRALAVGIHCFNVESEAELEQLAALASEQGSRAPIAIRVNPDVDAETHPYIATGLQENKFGVDIPTARRLYTQASQMASIRIRGIGFHIGSQLTRLDPLLDALDRVIALAEELEADGIALEHIDVGGGLGITYRDEQPPTPQAYGAALASRLAGRHWTVLLEPGRAIAGQAGVLLTRVQLLKHTTGKHFAVVDGAMNDLIRPALYGAWQAIVPVQPRTSAKQCYDIVGPVCETGDFLGHARDLALEAGDLLAVGGAGAYGFVMAGNYNTRPRPPEIMVDGDRYYVVNRREQVDHLLMREGMLPPEAFTP